MNHRVARWTRPLLAVSLVVMPLAMTVAAPPPAPEKGGKTFETDGLTIYYEEIGGGAGLPLVVANGSPGFDHTYLHCSDAWDRLGTKRKVVFYDQRGNGRSSELKPGQSCLLADQIADLDALRAQLGVEKMDLLGHSWGGYLVMAYAARYPDRIAHLMIVDSAAPKVQDTVFLFKNIYPETVSHGDGLAFGVELGDAKAIGDDLRQYLSMIFYSPEIRDSLVPKFDP